MNENDKSRSGLQTAVDFAHAARAAKRIMQAAAVSGVHGAAAATAREAFPLLLKILIAALVVFIVVPMVIFTALPNIFFGYNSSGTDTVIQMTQQAMTLGGVYMTLGNFEGAQIDSVVTGIAAEYEKNGTTIDHIVVSSAMTDDDLLWVIAINSAAHQQDLNTMSADLIRDFCKSSLSYTPSLSFMDSGDDGVVTTLRIEVKHLDPEKLMDELGFDDEARQWAGALYETLEESDAINKYRSYYEAYQPGYGGDGSYSGDVEYGSGYDNKIDISGFVDPSTKNNLDLASYAIQAWANNWGYVWGTYRGLHYPVHLLSCDETGARQLQIMAVPDYRVKLAKLMLRSAYRPPPEDAPAWDAIYQNRPFVIGADMNLRWIDAAIASAKKRGCLPISLAALDAQGDAVLLRRYKDTGYAVIYKVTESVLTELFGRPPSLYLPPCTQYLTKKGAVVDAPLIQVDRKDRGSPRK